MANAKDVLKVAVSQIGICEKPSGSNNVKYNTWFYGKHVYGDKYAWCATFLDWCFQTAGCGSLYPHNANAAYAQDQVVSKCGGKWIMKKNTSKATRKSALKKYKKGDIVDFDFGAMDAYRRHTGIVEKVIGDYVICIEGNTSKSGSQSNGGMVCRKERHYTDICSCARPKYTGEKKYTPKSVYNGKLPKLPERGYFKKGDKGEQVGNVQTFLNWIIRARLVYDKDYGNATAMSVGDFQSAYNLKYDEEFGKECLKKAEKLVAEYDKKYGTDTQEKPQEAVTATKTDEPTNTSTSTDKTKISKKVLDISAWQGNVSEADWKKVIKDGITCVILRSSYTEQKSFTMHKDKVFENNIKSAIKAGMHIGIYHYSQAITESEAGKEADFMLDIIKPYKKHIDLPVAFDWEFGGRLNASVAKRLGKTKNTAICDSFCNKVKKAGYEPMVYANLSTLNNYLSANLYKTWKIWVAQYNKTCDYKHPWFLWQYTSSGKCSGISGKLDVSVFAEKKDSFFPDRGYFKKGDKGDNVKEVQKMLKKANKGAHWTIEVTGTYDEKTVKFVKLLQDARHITVDGYFGKDCLAECKKDVTIQMRTVNRAVSVCRSSKYVYGVGKRAHRYGDPFSKTNTGPVMKKKEQKGEAHYVNKKGNKWKEGDGEKYTYENTMCCNPFVSMCYAYGGEVDSVLKAVKKGSGFGTSPDTITRYGFKSYKLKDVAYKDIKAGDIIIIPNHALLCTGGGYLAEAGSEGWDKKSISQKKILKSRYDKYKSNPKAYLCRYPKK